MRIIRLLGSLYFAVSLIATLTLVLILSTSQESLFGTSFAQKFIYKAGWFDVLLALFAVNIFCSAALRFPFKRHHTGFVVTHIGIFALLFGSLFTRLFGVDGQLALYEGESGGTASQSAYQLVAHAQNGSLVSWDLMEGPGRSIQTPSLSDTGIKLVVRRIVENYSETFSFDEGRDTDAENAALIVDLVSARADQRQTVRLVEKNPFDPSGPTRTTLGPAEIEMKKVPLSSGAVHTGPTLLVGLKDPDVVVPIDVLPAPVPEVPVGKSGIVIRDLRYFPDARVGAGGELISASSEPLNPAVSFEVLGPGDHERGDLQHHHHEHPCGDDLVRGERDQRGERADHLQEQDRRRQRER